MATEREQERPSGSVLSSAISTMIVRLMREYTGRGPMKAHTTIRDDVVLVMLEQTLTKGEQVLVEKGRGENVLILRREYQNAIRDESSQKIAELTGRVVIAMMSANHLVPDLAAEIYVLDGPPVQRKGPSPDGAQQPRDGELAEPGPANPMSAASARSNSEPNELDGRLEPITLDLTETDD
jgi:uncharacterized protein YbcI